MSIEPDRIDAAIQAGDAQGALPGDVIVGTGGGRSAARAPRPAAAARSFVGRVDKPVMPPAALACADVVDSTLLVERLGDERAAQVWAAHDRCARDLMVLHPGREVVRPDGFFLLFDAWPMRPAMPWPTTRRLPGSRSRRALVCTSAP